MSRTRRQRPDLAELIDLEALIGADEEADAEELRRRDRMIGRTIGDLAGDRRALFLAWLEHMRERRNSLPGRPAVEALGLASFFLAVFGLLGGAGTAAGLFAYDGTHPVNVVYILGVFVGFQLVLIALWVLSALPRRWLQALPAAAGLHESVRLLTPGRWTSLVARFLSHRHRDALERAWGRLGVFERLYGDVRWWTFVRTAQSFSLAFNAGAITTALALVTLTDLAFGWSTTLDVAPRSFHRLTSILATPWASALPAAVPTEALVESTRYVRLSGSFVGDEPGRAAASAAASGEWWSFLIACMVVYGLAPRLATTLLARWRLRAALRRVALDHAGYDRLYDRLTEPLVETRSPEIEHHAPSPETGIASEVSGVPRGSALIIDWGGVGLGENAIRELLQERFGCGVAGVVSAGGLDVHGDERAIERVERENEASVWLLVKAYEAPTRDLQRFLQSLRRTLGNGRPIVVLPLDPGESSRLDAVDPEDLRQWARAVRALGDPWVRLQPSTRGA